MCLGDDVYALDEDDLIEHLESRHDDFKFEIENDTHEDDIIVSSSSEDFDDDLKNEIVHFIELYEDIASKEQYELVDDVIEKQDVIEKIERENNELKERLNQ